MGEDGGALIFGHEVKWLEARALRPLLLAHIIGHGRHHLAMIMDRQ